MKIDNIVEIFKKNATNHPNDSRQIIKHKNSVLLGNQYGIVLSNINNKVFEVFFTAVINKEVISQILYTTFNNINEATDYYNKLEVLIDKNNLESIVNEIQKNDLKND